MNWKHADASCRPWFLLCLASLILLISPSEASLHSAEVFKILSDQPNPIAGKEADWIDGDFVLRNKQLVAVIAQPGSLRDANMTVRGVGACIIDLTRQDEHSDQLSCFYPGAGRFLFHDESLVDYGVDPNGDAYWRCTSSGSVSSDGSVATLEYRLGEDAASIQVTFVITNTRKEKVKPIDGVRADRTFVFKQMESLGISYCEDLHFRQTYGFKNLVADKAAAWSNDRMRQLRYGGEALELLDGSVRWQTEIYPASSPVDLWGILKGGEPQRIKVSGAVGDQPRVRLSLLESEATTSLSSSTWMVAEDGFTTVHLPVGTYPLQIEAIGHATKVVDLEVVSDSHQHVFNLGRATSVSLKVTNEAGSAVPCKVTFFGKKQESDKVTPNPVFGIDSQSGSVGNCVYSADGTILRSIPPGSYDVLISRGPEYDVEIRELELEEGQQEDLAVTLRRVVDTTGWVSAELHSHSSPSGDNTSDQLGRVENLVCENLEFAPCTEHQRIDSYDDQLKILGATRFMATCSGMELTGSLLPINHQNAFPLKWKPRTQDGGGPRTDNQDPVNQIARLAMWDDGSEKIVQSNHPNMRQMLRDRNLDGEPDGGFSKMLDFMDVIEVHPPEMIFLDESQTQALKNPDSNRMLPWMKLLAQGNRIPGVVNTDAHYNFHGSGSLRNWIRSSTDDPAEISTSEMTRRLESGQVIMSTGPFMSVSLNHPSLDAAAEIGDVVQLPKSGATLDVKVQCANWLDVNRVEVFVNGQLQPSLSRTRSTHPEAFGQGVVKFEEALPLAFESDSFVIVAAIGERLQLGRVMGEKEGKRQPVVVSNPIFVSVR